MFSRICQLLTWTSLGKSVETTGKSALQRNSLYPSCRAVRFANFGLFCCVNHLSGPLRKHIFTCTSSKGHGFWFMIDGVLSVLFVSCFKSRCFVIYNRLDKFASQIYLIFLILVTCKNKTTSASLFLSSLESFLAELGDRACYPDCDLHNPPLLKWLTEQKNPNSLRSLQKTQRDTTNLVIILVK